MEVRGRYKRDFSREYTAMYPEKIRGNIKGYGNGAVGDRGEVMVKKIVRTTLGCLFLGAGILGGLYVGLWLTFTQPLLNLCEMYEAGILTFGLVVRVFFVGILGFFGGWILFFTGLITGSLFRPFS